MSQFTDWFQKKLIVGAFPYLVNIEFNPLDYGYVINMSDEFYDRFHSPLFPAKTFWFPMNERRRDIGLNSIYGAMVILSQAEKQNEPVYIHCHSGRNRSRIAHACYYYMRTGNQLQDGNEKYINRLHRASVRGYLPPMAEMEEFLRNVAKSIDNMKGGNLDKCKLGTINNF